MHTPVTLPDPATDGAARPALALGARCVSVRSVPSARWTYVAPAVYEVRARKDGALYWRCVHVAPLGRDVRFRSAAKARRAAVELASEMGVEVRTVRHGGRV